MYQQTLRRDDKKVVSFLAIYVFVVTHVSVCEPLSSSQPRQITKTER